MFETHKHMDTVIWVDPNTFFAAKQEEEDEEEAEEVEDEEAEEELFWLECLLR